MSRLGSRIASELLKVEKTYNVKRHSGEATVKVLELALDGVMVEIQQGGFNGAGVRYKKGDTATLPYDSDWYEPQI